MPRGSQEELAGLFRRERRNLTQFNLRWCGQFGDVPSDQIPFDHLIQRRAQHYTQIPHQGRRIAGIEFRLEELLNLLEGELRELDVLQPRYGIESAFVPLLRSCHSFGGTVFEMWLRTICS